MWVSSGITPRSDEGKLEEVSAESAPGLEITWISFG
jgi:hypothetical protein